MEGTPNDPVAERQARALADRMGLEYIDLRDAYIPEHLVELIPESLAREHCVIPYSEGIEGLQIITANPSDNEVTEKLRFVLNRSIICAVAPESYIRAAIDLFFTRWQHLLIDHYQES